MYREKVPIKCIEVKTYRPFVVYHKPLGNDVNGIICINGKDYPMDKMFFANGFYYPKIEMGKIDKIPEKSNSLKLYLKWKIFNNWTEKFSFFHSELKSINDTCNGLKNESKKTVIHHGI